MLYTCYKKFLCVEVVLMMIEVLKKLKKVIFGAPRAEKRPEGGDLTFF